MQRLGPSDAENDLEIQISLEGVYIACQPASLSTHQPH